MKILQIYNDYYPPVCGGIEKHINTICEGLKDKCEIEALVCNRKLFGKTDYINNVRVKRAGELGRIQSAPISLSFPILLKKTQCDILHFHLPCPTAVIGYFLARPKGKIIVTYHSDIVRQKWAMGIYRPLLVKFLKRADKIITTSPDYIKSSQILNRFRDKCIVIPHGVDPDKFEIDDKKHNVVYTDKSTPVILFVGKLRYYKGIEYLIEAMKSVNAILLIIGTGSEEKKLKKMVESMNLSSKITFLGNIPDNDLSYYYNNCEMFVLPSVERSEAFGIVQLEAMACGKPVISTALSTGVPWVNKDGITGLVVPPKNSQELAKAINKLLNNPRLATEYGNTGKIRVKETFSSSNMLEKLESLYKTITS